MDLHHSLRPHPLPLAVAGLALCGAGLGVYSGPGLASQQLIAGAILFAFLCGLAVTLTRFERQPEGVATRQLLRVTLPTLWAPPVIVALAFAVADYAPGLGLVFIAAGLGLFFTVLFDETLAELRWLRALPGGEPSLREAIERLHLAGYTEDFLPESGGLRALRSGRLYPASRLHADEVLRFEGESDPDDEAIVYALSGLDEEVFGTLALSYSAQLAPEEIEALQQLREVRA